MSVQLLLLLIAAASAGAVIAIVLVALRGRTYLLLLAPTFLIAAWAASARGYGNWAIAALIGAGLSILAVFDRIAALFGKKS